MTIICTQHKSNMSTFNCNRMMLLNLKMCLIDTPHFATKYFIFNILLTARLVAYTATNAFFYNLQAKHSNEKDET